MRVELVGIFLSVSLLCGCARDDVTEEINHAIDEVCSMRVNSHMMTRVGKLSDELSKKIFSLDNRIVQRACVRRWAAKLMSFNPDRLECSQRGDYLCDMLDRHGIRSIVWMYGKAGATREDQLDVMIEMLSFMRKHIQRLREDVKSHPTGKNGRVVTDMKAFMAYTECVRSYNGAAINYENYLFGVEYAEFDLVLKELPDDIKKKMRRKFEAFLGRPMRTNAECRRDLKGRIHREFPIISLTTTKMNSRNGDIP